MKTAPFIAAIVSGLLLSPVAAFTQTNPPPPVIGCETNRIVECGAAWDFDTPSVTVSCVPTNFTLIFETVTNELIGQTFSAIRTWTVTDACSNSASCSQTITILDRTPPEIVCPSNIIAAEFPHDGGSASVVFPEPLASDICDSNLTLVSSPPSGSAFPLGFSTVLCTAQDDSGNTNGCSFSVRVIPYRLPVTAANDSGAGSLRQAMLDANAAPGENLIVFNLPDAGPHTILLFSPLPEVTSPVIIDGWSQPGFSGAPMIEINGTNSGLGVDGLVITSGSSMVRGLVFNGFANGIRLGGNGGNSVQGNYIGTDPTGTNALGNFGDGIYVSSADNMIGGTELAARNVISGNTGSGIRLVTPNAANNLMEGNLIGMAADGTSPLGNGQDGVALQDGAANNTIGGTSNGAENIIGFNGTNGVALDVSAGTGNAVLGNAIASHAGLGIDLGRDGVTANDPNDTDTGPNNLQNFPALSDARSIGGITTIEGTLNGTANTSYRLEFFLNDAANASGFGEGQTFIGAATVILGGNGSENFSVPFPVTATWLQFVTATATDEANNTSEFSQAKQVRTPPIIDVHPVSTNPPPGTAASFCVTASGTPPLSYQWRLNGANIFGATNPCYAISNVQAADGGNYTVVVGNDLGAVRSAAAALLPPVDGSAAADNFVDRVSLFGTNGVTAGTNRFATREPGEPDHAGKPGGKSVWYTWNAPVTGVATFGTRGSTFDTLLGIYTGTTVSNLTTVASDEDRGGFFTSGARFNAIRGVQYHIAIDGFGGTEGDFVFVWSEEETPHLLPFILTEPQSQTVAPGSSATFSVVAARVCGNGQRNCPDGSQYPGGEIPLLTFQWFFNGDPIPGAVASTLTVTNVVTDNVGNYTVQVTQQDPTHPRTVESLPASLQLNETGDDIQAVLAWDKFLDSAASPSLFLGAPTELAPARSTVRPAAAAAIVRGYTGTQIFNTVGATTEATEEPICGVVGGASEWISFVAEESGDLLLDTDGSTYDTVMAVFARSITNAPALQLVDCDNNGGTNGLTSSLSVPVQAGVTNFIVIDGVNGAVGILQLNYSLVTTTVLTPLGMTPQGFKLRVHGRPDLHFTIQTSSDFVHWTSLVTTNAPTGIFDFVDTISSNASRRSYRALLLP